MKMPAITVLMPAYNAARFIGPAVESVLQQTFADFELLIVDDASTDNTENVVSRVADRRIRWIRNPENLQITGTLNRGLQEARGEYIARLDADDLCYPNRLAEQLRVLENDLSVGLAASWTEIIDEAGQTRGFGNWRLSPEAIYYVLHFRQCLTHSSVMFRKALVQDLGGYSSHALKAEDFDLWHRISKIRKIVQLPKVLVKWRDHRANISRTGTREMEQGAFQLCKQFIRDLTGEPHPDEIIQGLIDCHTLRESEPRLRLGFPAALMKIQRAIAANAPAVYDLAALSEYMQVEAAKYAHLFRSLHEPFPTELSTNARALGFLYYLSRCRRLPFVGSVLPKSHF